MFDYFYKFLFYVEKEINIIVLKEYHDIIIELRSLLEIPYNCFYRCKCSNTTAVGSRIKLIAVHMIIGLLFDWGTDSFIYFLLIEKWIPSQMHRVPAVTYRKLLWHFHHSRRHITAFKMLLHQLSYINIPICVGELKSAKIGFWFELNEK